MSFTYDAGNSTGWLPHANAPADFTTVPYGWRFHSYARNENFASIAYGTSGTSIVGQIWLPAGLTIARIGFVVGTAGATTPTHHWMALWDTARYVVAASADLLTAAIPASTGTVPVTMSYTLGSPYTTAYEGRYYIEHLQTATTPAQYMGMTSSSVINAIPPILSGTGAGSLTGPPAVASVRAAITPGLNIPYFLAV